MSLRKGIEDAVRAGVEDAMAQARGEAGRDSQPSTLCSNDQPESHLGVVALGLSILSICLFCIGPVSFFFGLASTSMGLFCVLKKNDKRLSPKIAVVLGALGSCVGLLVTGIQLFNFVDDTGTFGSSAPVSSLNSESWVRKQVLKELARHGEFQGNTWKTAVIGGNGRGRLWQFINVQANCEEIQLTNADQLNGIEWAFSVDLSTTAVRELDENSNAKSDWIDRHTLTPNAKLVVQRQKNEVLWGIRAAWLPNEVHVDQANVLDSLLNDYQHPAKTMQQKRDIEAILEVLRSDSNAASSGTKFDGTIDSKLVVEKMSTINLANCPEKFRTAYTVHLDAWKVNDKTAIENTWHRVLEQARSFGAGTIQGGY